MFTRLWNEFSTTQRFIYLTMKTLSVQFDTLFGTSYKIAITRKALAELTGLSDNCLDTALPILKKMGAINYKKRNGIESEFEIFSLFS